MTPRPHADLAGWLQALFDSVDAQDTAAFVGFLTEDALFRFASAPPVTGTPAIATTVHGFFASIAGSRHRVVESWLHDDTVVCRGEVIYSRHDGSAVELPFANFMRLRQGRVDRYLIYADLGPLLGGS